MNIFQFKPVHPDVGFNSVLELTVGKYYKIINEPITHDWTESWPKWEKGDILHFATRDGDYILTNMTRKKMKRKKRTDILNFAINSKTCMEDYNIVVHEYNGQI